MKKDDIVIIILHIIFGVLMFIGFAYDIENDRDFWTWIWLLTSILNFITIIFILFKILIKKINHVEDQTT
jgi:large-conductance mechanosensitive channel